MLNIVKVWRKFVGNTQAMPHECCSFCEIFYIFVESNVLIRWMNIYESVFRSPNLKMWKFSKLRDKRTALISCVVVWLCTLCAYLPHTIQVWGIISFISV